MTLETDNQADQAEQAQQVAQVEPLTELLNNLYIKSMLFSSLISKVRDLHTSDEFKLLSKKSRNNLLFSVIDGAGELEELSKVAFKQLKKVKRERVPEDKIDAMLGIPESIRNMVRGQEDEQDDGQ